MGKYDAVGIRIGVDFESYSSVKTKLDSLLSKFKDNAKTIDIDINIKDVNKQLQEIEKTLKTLDNASKIVANNMAKSFTDAVKTSNKEMEKAQKEAERTAKKSGSTGAFANDDSLKAYVSKTRNEINNLLNLKIGNDSKLVDELDKVDKALSNLTTGTSKEDLQKFKNQLGDFKKEATEFDKMTSKVQALQTELAEVNKLTSEKGFVVPDNLKNEQYTANASVSLLDGRSSEESIRKAIKAVAEYKQGLIASNEQIEKELETRHKIKAEIDTAQKALMANVDRTKTTKAGDFLDASKIREYENAVKNLNANSMDELRRKVKELNIEWEGIANSAQRMAKNSSFFGQIGSAMKSMAGYYISGQMISKVTQGLREGVQTVIELDTALVDLKKVSTETDATLNSFVGTANKMAIGLGHSTTAVINSVTDFIKVGYDFKEAQDMAKSTIIYSNVGDMDITSATEAMISAMKAFEKEGWKSIEVVDKLNEVANNYAVSAGGLGEALKRSASSMSTANNSLDQTLALVAGANAVVQNESKVGNALKTISMRLRGISEDSGELIPNLRETFMLLTNNKVDIMADEDTFKSTYDIMLELGAVWDTLSDKQRAYLAELSSGKTQANVFVSIMENIEDVEKAYVDSMNSQGSAMAEQNRYMESLQAKINTLKESVVAFWNAMVDSGTVGSVIDALTNIVNLATKLVDTLGSVPTVLGGLGLGMGLFKSDMMGDLGKNLVSSFGKAQTAIKDVRQEMTFLSGTGRSFGQNIVSSMTQVAGSTGVATKAVALLKTTLMSVGTGLAIGLVFTAIAKLVQHVTQARQRVEEAIDSAKSNIGSLNQEIKVIEDLGSSYEEMSRTMGSLSGFQKAGADEQKRYLDVSEQLLEAIPTLAVAFTDEGEAIVLAGQNLESHIDYKRELIEIERELLAINSQKLLKEDNNSLNSKKQELEDIQSRIQDLQTTINTIKENGLDKEGTIASATVKDAQEAIGALTIQMKEAQLEVGNLKGTISGYVNDQLRVNESYKGLSASAQQAVQTVLNFDTTLAENSGTIDSVVGTIGKFVNEFENMNFKEGIFNVEEFAQVQIKMIEFLRTLGLTESQVYTLSQAITGQYKQAYIEANKAIKDTVDYTKLFNDELAKLGGDVLDHADNIIQLKTALKELDETNGLSASTLRGLVDEYPALITVIGDEEAQRRILMGAITEQEKLQMDVIKTITDLEIQSAKLKIEADEEWFNNKNDVINKVLANVSWANTQELQQAKNLAQAKMAVDNEYAKRHAELMKKIYSAGRPTSIDLTQGTKNSNMISVLEQQLNSDAVKFNPIMQNQIQQQINSLKAQDQAMLADARQLDNEYKQLINGFDEIVMADIDFNGIGKLPTVDSLNKLNTPSSSDKKKREEKEKIFSYNGSELNKYANELERIVGLIDRYDKELEGLHEKKERLHDKQLYEEELALIDEIVKKEEHRGVSYQNRIRDIEANNKAILDEFKAQEGFTLSKYSEAELAKIFNDKYGDKKDFKNESEKEAYEAKAKNFQNLVRAYYDGVSAIEDLEDRLEDTHDTLVQLSVEAFQIQVELDERKLQRSADTIDNLSKSLEILQTLGGDNLKEQVELMAQIAGSETYKRQELERQIGTLQEQLLLLDATDARYQLIVDRVKELKDAQYDSYINELKYRNDIKNKLMEQMELELEKQLYGSGGQQAWEDENNSKINALKDQLDLLKQQTDEKKKQEEAEKRALEIQKLRDKLENLKKQKTIQQLKQNADGSWEWEYVADQEAISKVEQEIKDKEKEQADKEAEEEEQKRQDEIQAEIDKLNEEAKIRREAYQRMLNELKKQMNSQQNIFEMSGKDIQSIVDSTMNSLDKLYNGKFSSIVESIRAQASELSGIFESARDEAEGWYDEAVKPPSTSGSGSTGSSGSSGSSSSDKTPEQIEAWHARKDSIAKTMQKNANAWKGASETEKKRLEKENEELGKQIGAWKNSSTGVWYIEVFEQKMPLFDSIGYRKYKTGGEVSETGLQWLDGEKGKPERVLSAEQTQAFNRMVEIMPDFLEKMKLFSNIAPNMGELVQNLLGSGISIPRPTGATPIGGNNGQTVIVENIELPNVTDADKFRKEMAEFLNGSFSGLSQSAKVQKSK